MSIQNYGTAPSRNLIRAAQDMLEHAQPITVLGDFGTFQDQPKRSTDTLVFRRVLPVLAGTAGYGIGSAQYVGTPGSSNGAANGNPQINAGDFALAEGTTPNSRSVTFQDVSVTLQQWGILFKFSSKVELMYEDDIPAEMTKLVGETMAEVLEQVRYGVLKAGTTVVYANGSSRGSVNSVISLNALRKAVRVLESNRAKRVTSMIAPGVKYDTRAIPAGYVVFVHTDAIADVRNLPGFVPVEKYAGGQKIHDREFGSVEDFRFISSPLLAPFYGAGSSTTNGCVSIAGSNVDVYPFIVMAESAWGQVALKGMRAITPTVLRSGDRSHANPLGQFGFVGATTWFNAVRLNEGWMARIECGVTNL